jgi:hypothetical protein
MLNLCLNVPIRENLNLKKAQLIANNDKQTTHQIMTLLDMILRQNYLSFNDQMYQPDKGVAMGTPISGTMAQVFLQHLEKTIIKHLIDTKILPFYTRYVDDILLICDSTHTNADNILQYIGTIHHSIQFSPTLESNNKVHFLDLSITRKPTCLELSIYLKPTTTDTTINFLSNHPLEHKLAAYWFLISRMLTLPINREHEEWQHILHIAHSNNIPPYLLTRLKLRIQRNLSQPKSPTPTTVNNSTLWATFTYSSPQIRKVTNIFKHTNVQIAFKRNNTISQLARPYNKTIPSKPYNRSGIYALSCITCNKVYISQTSRSLKLHYMEHTRYIKGNNPQSAYALHILNNQHKYSPIEKTMTLLKPLKSTSLLTPYEHLFMQSLHKAGRLISEQSPGEINPLLQLAFNPSHPPRSPG